MSPRRRDEEYIVEPEPVEPLEPDELADIADLCDEIALRRKVTRRDVRDLQEAAKALRAEASARSLDEVPAGALLRLAVRQFGIWRRRR